MSADADARIGGTTARGGARLLRRLAVASLLLALSLGSGGTQVTGADEAPARSPSLEVVPSTASLDSDLAELFPISVNGRLLEVASWSGPEWVARLDPQDRDGAAAIRKTEALVASTGKTLEDLMVATALFEPSPGNYATIAAMRVPGSQALQLIDPVIDVMVGVISPETVWRSIADRWVIVVRDAAVPGMYPVTVYPSGDTVWVMQAERQFVEALLMALPPQAPLRGPVGDLERVEVPEFGLAVSFPTDWTIRTISEDPDLGFLVISGPERFGPDVRMQPILHAEPKGQEPETGSLPDACTLVLYRPITLTPDEFMGEFYGQAEDISVESLHERLSRVRFGPGPFTSERLHGQYAIGGDDAIAFLWCSAVEPPYDHWLSIAESFEFLPEDED